MSVMEALRDAMERRKLSKNEMIRRTGIDRSTFYQIMGGRRTATTAQFAAILDELHPDEKERIALIRIYEKERAGEEAYADWEKIRQFWKRLDILDRRTAPPQTILCSIIGQAMEQAAARSDSSAIRIFLPEDLLGRLGVYSDLRQIAAMHPDHEIKAELLLAPMPESTMFETVLDNLPELLDLLRAQNIRISAGSIPAAAAQFTYVNPYPYFVIAGETLVLVSADGNRLTRMTEKSFLLDYADTFQSALARAGNMIDTTRNLPEMMKIVSGSFQRFAGQEFYILTPVPCVNLSITDEQMKSYMVNETYLAFKHAIEQTGMKEFTCMSGTERMLREKSMNESGVHIDIRPEDIPTLKNNLKARLGKDMFYLDEKMITIPRDWSMYVLGEDRLIILPHDNTRFLLTVSSRQIVERFAGWFRSRLEMINADLLSLQEAQNQLTNLN